MNYKINLYNKNKDCCGCGACKNICPKNAINMKIDEFGFYYPDIDRNRCVECGLCSKICSYKKSIIESNILNSYAACGKNVDSVTESASGGIFFELANSIINKSGTVYGVAMFMENDLFYTKHIRVDNVKSLNNLRGSKYVQSDLGDIYKCVKQDLDLNKYVLFSGTPCQVDGLKGYLNKTYEKLLLVDIICHGVPSNKMFNDYIKNYEFIKKCKVKKIKFRDKSKGWEHNISIRYIDKHQNEKTKYFHTQLSSYYSLFLSSKIFRENCYSCKYASKNRVSDITLGDFWGIKEEYPNYLIQNGGKLDEKLGISCILINTEKGEKYFDDIKDNINYYSSEFEKIAKHNKQLSKSSTCSEDRKIIFDLYKNNGYNAVEKWYNKKLGIKKYIYILYNKLPAKLKLFLKNII